MSESRKRPRDQEGLCIHYEDITMLFVLLAVAFTLIKCSTLLLKSCFGNALIDKRPDLGYDVQ